jgi:hypothetical protein
MSERDSTTDLHPLFSGTQVALEDRLRQAGYLKAGESLTITREGPEGWQRARCPKCNYMRAQVHLGLGYFWCPKVRTWTDENGSHVEPCLRVNIPRESPVFQFSDLIVKVIGSASVRKYGDWFPGYEAAQVCEELLVRYVRAGLIDRLASIVQRP